MLSVIIKSERENDILGNKIYLVFFTKGGDAYESINGMCYCR